MELFQPHGKVNSVMILKYINKGGECNKHIAVMSLRAGFRISGFENHWF